MTPGNTVAISLDFILGSHYGSAMTNWASSSLDAIKRQIPGLDPVELEGPIRTALREARSDESARRLCAMLKEIEAQRRLNSEGKPDRK